MPKSTITDIVLDFDGTCTQIPVIFEKYLEQYLLELNRAIITTFPAEPLITNTEWAEAQILVKQNSPMAGWMLGGGPSAPSYADPFILSDEATKLILRLRKSKITLPPVYSVSYASNPAPWRTDALDTFRKIVAKGVRLHFISNSSTTKVSERLRELFGENDPLLKQIIVQGDAAKFNIKELTWEKNVMADAIVSRFQSLPASYPSILHEYLGRPVYLRRGSYFEAIYSVFKARLTDLSQVVFCGDIFELDLAMPAELGANVHLIKRQPPFDTYPYELNAVAALGIRAKLSDDLSALMDWID